MSLVQRTLPSLFNGVSRQPAILRSQDQTESELNTWSSLSAGVGKRPPTQHIAKLFASLPPGAHIHAINRDSTERYFVIITVGSIRVFGFDGTEFPVSAPGGLSYLDGADFAAITVADYTFIVNRTRKVALKAAGADEAAPPPYLRFPSTKQVGHIESMPDDGDPISGQPVQYGSNPTSAALTGTVGTMEDLPETAPDGSLYKVSGNTGDGFTSFYVRRNGPVWDEAVAPGQQNSLDEATMPHCLIREANGTFTFAPFSWAPRRVGDAGSNPAPTFVSRTIRDVAFYQNRLVFLVGESVVMSCAGDFGNFFRTTVLDLIASDMIDVAAATTNVATLDFITLFNDGALLFADQTQFALSNAEEGVSPASVAIRPVTRYPLSRKARPVVVNTEVYFAGDNAGYSTLYEYTRQSGSDNTSAAEITAHVPGLIPSGLTSLVPLPRGLLALTGTPALYCYQFYWNGDEKVQSSWREWLMSGAVMASASIDSSIYMVVQEADGVYLERMELADGYKVPTQSWTVYLDRQAHVAGVEADNATTLTLPYAVPEDHREDFVVVGGSNGTYSYSEIDLSGAEWLSSTTLRIPRVGLGTAAVGFRIDFHIEPSRQFQVTPQGVPMTTGRLLLRQWTVNYTQTFGFDIQVWPYGRASHPMLEAKFPKKEFRFTARILGTGSSVLGQAAPAEGSYSFTITGDASKAVFRLSDRSHGGTTFTSAEWEGFYNRRS